MPACVPRTVLLASLAPAALVNIWPWALVAHGDVNVAYGAFLWLFPWLGCGAIWTVMTQVSHAQADAQAGRRTNARHHLHAAQAPSDWHLS